MPADLRSALMLVLLEAGELAWRLWPYVVGGLVVSWLLSASLGKRIVQTVERLPRVAATPLAVVVGAISPIPTSSVVPLLVRLRRQGLDYAATVQVICLPQVRDSVYWTTTETPIAEAIGEAPGRRTT